MKLLITLMVLALLTACAKPAPPPAVPPPMIPINLVNIENDQSTRILVMPEEPSDLKMIRIKASDPADEALRDTLQYTKQLKVYSEVLETISKDCRGDLADREDRLDKIKQYILLRQPVATQPVY